MFFILVFLWRKEEKGEKGNEKESKKEATNNKLNIIVNRLPGDTKAEDIESLLTNNGFKF